MSSQSFVVGTGPFVHGMVKFTKDAALGILVPAELSETVEASAGGTGMSNMGGGGDSGSHRAMEGRATYAKYRRAADR